MPNKQATSIRIRSYNVGLGDCFLVSFHDLKNHILVDFGTAPGQPKYALRAIAENIKEVTNQHLDVVVVSTDHHDHVDGFLSQSEIFDTIDVDHVWMGPTGAPKFYDEEAKKLKMARILAGKFLDNHEESGLKEPLKTLISNNLLTTNQLNYVRKLRNGKRTANVQYLNSGSTVELPFGNDFKVDVLSPHTDIEPYFNNSEFDFWDEIFDLDSISTRLNSNLSSAARKKHPLMCGPSFKNAACVDAKDEPRHLLDRDWQMLKKKNRMFGPPEMQAIDTVVNNLSLILLFTIDGKKLLFPGDADEFALDSLDYCGDCQLYGETKNCAKCRKRKELSKSIDFLKLAQHGSKPQKPDGSKTGFTDELGKYLNKNATIMVSTRAGVYGAKKPVPDPRLIEKLKVTYKGKLIETNDDHLWIDALI